MPPRVGEPARKKRRPGAVAHIDDRAVYPRRNHRIQRRSHTRCRSLPRCRSALRSTDRGTNRHYRDQRAGRDRSQNAPRLHPHDPSINEARRGAASRAH